MPLACSLSKSVWLWGFDGRAPDDKLFWANSSKHSYPELLPELQQEHPAFFRTFVPKDKENSYVTAVHGDELDRRLIDAERDGYEFVMMHASWTHTLNKRRGNSDAAAPRNAMSRPAIRTAGRVTVFCQDVPYPPTHGGKLDLWNLIRALHSNGHVIQLVCWFKHERIPSRVRTELSKFAEDVVEVPRRDGLWRLLIPKYPPRMLAFKPSTRQYARLLDRVAAFSPDWILLDHWLAYLPARAVATDLRKVLVYRSQNVEHRYYREQSRLARGILKLKLAANLRRLFAAEREIRNTVDLVADISSDDRMEWEALGETRQGIVVPPIWLDSPPPSSPRVEQDIDLLFCGKSAHSE